jgi:hypothetical protein
MLTGHMDTVYQKGILATQPWRVDGNRICGPGIADDKGGLAVILHALKILGDAGWRDYVKTDGGVQSRRRGRLDRLRRIHRRTGGPA